MSLLLTPTLARSPFERADVLGARTVGQETMPRWGASSGTSVALTSGVVRFAYFIASRSEAVTLISVACGATAAGATPTLVRYGLYQVAVNGDLAQASATASDTTLLGVVSTPSPKTMSAGVNLIAGQQYAVAALCVTSATAPTIMGVQCATGVDNALTPRLCGLLTGQTDLLSSYTAGQIAGTASMFYAAVR